MADLPNMERAGGSFPPPGSRLMVGEGQEAVQTPFPDGTSQTRPRGELASRRFSTCALCDLPIATSVWVCLVEGQKRIGGDFRELHGIFAVRCDA